MTMIMIICFVIPFTLFFYEADSDKCAPFARARKKHTHAHAFSLTHPPFLGT